MSFPERVALLLDGEFAKRALHKGRKRFPTAEDVRAEVQRLGRARTGVARVAVRFRH